MLRDLATFLLICSMWHPPPIMCLSLSPTSLSALMCVWNIAFIMYTGPRRQVSAPRWYIKHNHVLRTHWLQITHFVSTKTATITSPMDPPSSYSLSILTVQCGVFFFIHFFFLMLKVDYWAFVWKAVRNGGNTSISLGSILLCAWDERS